MSGLSLTITAAGRAALINAKNNGTNPVLLSEIGVSATHFVADAETSGLPDEIKRLSTFAGQTVASDTLHVTLRDDSSDHYTLRSFALYLDNGTLLAVYSQPEAILEKSAQAIVLLAVDIQLLQDHAALIQFGPADFINPPATAQRPGVIELANDSQAVDGIDPERAITPVTLKTVLDQHQQPWNRLIEIPASVHIPGQLILFAGPEPAPGTLACDGAQVLRQQYPALFAAIGTRYGEGDGQTTFHLPNIAEGFTHQADKVGSTTGGENKSHTHQATVSSNGSHAHTASSNTAGNHTHSAWTDAQGQHFHTYTRRHHDNRIRGKDYGGGIYRLQDDATHTSPAGNHAHNVGIGANGNHTHSISIAENGQHVHGISVDPNGAHNHAISVDPNGDHDHVVSNAETGGAHNLAAGLFIRCCIAY